MKIYVHTEMCRDPGKLVLSSHKCDCIILVTFAALLSEKLKLRYRNSFKSLGLISKRITYMHKSTSYLLKEEEEKKSIKLMCLDLCGWQRVIKHYMHLVKAVPSSPFFYV